MPLDLLFFCKCLNKSLPGCSGLLLPCVELVLDDLEDLLLVGRLLLPVSVITGGSTAAGGTCTETKGKRVACCTLHVICSYSICSEPKGIYLSKLGEETVYFLLLPGVEGLNLTHVSDGEGGNQDMRNRLQERK